MMSHEKTIGNRIICKDKYVMTDRLAIAGFTEMLEY